MFLSPSEIVNNFGLKPGMVVADFGCGSGHYSVEAAKLILPGGIIYAIDVQKDVLPMAQRRAEIDGLENVKIVWADLDLPNGSRLANGVADFVIISNILFQSENHTAMIDEAFRVLKNGGKLAVIEWQVKEEKIGPPLNRRISREEAERLFARHGFKIDIEFPAGESHYGLLFKKQ